MWPLRVAFQSLMKTTGRSPFGIFGRSYLVADVVIQDIPVTFLTFHLAPPAIGLMVTQYDVTHIKHE